MKRLKDYEVMPIFPVQPVTDPQISPDGTKTLLTYTTTNMKKNRRDSHIWLLPLEEKKPRQFTQGRGNDTSPRWSPDGRTILFLSDRLSEEEVGDEKRKMQIWVIRSDGGEARRLTSVDEGVQRPIWSPDGNNILFFSDVFKGERADGSDINIIRRIKYRFDGAGFYKGNRPHLFSVPSSGGKVRQLTDGEFDVEAACWSPDGGRIAFISNLEEDADLSFFKKIYLIPTKGGEPELLWEGEKAGIGMRWRVALEWSPDGRYLAFTGRMIENPDLVWYRNTDIWVLPVEGGEARSLTGNFDRTVGSYGGELRWSPDSKYIYFNSPDRGSVRLCRVSLDGKVETVVEGKMTVGSFTFDGSGSIIAFIATDAITPSELWIMDEKGLRHATEMNRGLLKRLKIIEPEEFWFTASDGSKVQGWIIKPRSFIEGEKYPMVLGIHGGPHGAYGYSLTRPDFQMLADHGFAVVYTNPRGSIGFGEAFTREIAGDYGKRDYMDIMESVDYVIDAYPFVDAEMLGVMGVSYGGYMTNWIVGHTDRFKAAIALNSESNYWSGYGTSDIGWMDHEIWPGWVPGDDLQIVIEKSPITYVKNIKTPLLLIHSEEDYRCNMEQSEQLFVALKKLKRVTEFVRFPGSHGHGSNGKPKHRVERLQHIVRWFDRYLRGN